MANISQQRPSAQLNMSCNQQLLLIVSQITNISDKITVILYVETNTDTVSVWIGQLLETDKKTSNQTAKLIWSS